jgi:hypothetical protein
LEGFEGFKSFERDTFWRVRKQWFKIWRLFVGVEGLGFGGFARGLGFGGFAWGLGFGGFIRE